MVADSPPYYNAYTILNVTQKHDKTHIKELKMNLTDRIHL